MLSPLPYFTGWKQVTVSADSVGEGSHKCMTTKTGVVGLHSSVTHHLYCLLHCLPLSVLSSLHYDGALLLLTFPFCLIYTVHLLFPPQNFSALLIPSMMQH